MTATVDLDNVHHPYHHRIRGKMSEVAINFEWSRAYSTKPGRAAYAIEGGKIVQVGDRRENYAPLRLGAVYPVYLEFAQLDGSPESCLGFAEKYGLLCTSARHSKPPSEELTLWKAEIKRMSGNLRALPNVIRIANSRGTYAKVATVDVLLVPGHGEGSPPVMVLEPGDLLQAMNLEMAQFISGGGRLVPCKNCGLLFQAGRAGGKRTIAQFHSDECRIAFNNAKRRGK
ncbi:hypothetical protein ABIB99_001897 [Bradyrhizobium sp. LA6.1]|uniref:hypothetical protein n=1 Tax=Bradyrhizobium sp. LA6.1 TaxID=3156378 RepID=UPI00339B8A3B